MDELELLQPDWPAPTRVKAYASTRRGGVSAEPYQGLNLGAHVGDDAAHVRENRQLLSRVLNLPSEPCWLNQVHGIDCVNLPGQLAQADAACTTQVNQVCVVMTADCLPVLFCDNKGEWVAAAHAGWRGLVDGVLESTIAQFSGHRSALMAWLGPAIGPTAFEVGPEVRAAFIAKNPDAEQAFTRGEGDRYFADLYALARQRLQAGGVTAVYGGGHCTYSESERFFSYRRDRITGRQASLIWLGARD